MPIFCFGILKQREIIVKIVAYFAYQKFTSQKHRKITTKKLTDFFTKILLQKNTGKLLTKNWFAFLTKKSMCIKGTPSNQGRVFHQFLLYFPYQKIGMSYICGQ